MPQAHCPPACGVQCLPRQAPALAQTRQPSASQGSGLDANDVEHLEERVPIELQVGLPLAARPGAPADGGRTLF